MKIDLFTFIVVIVMVICFCIACFVYYEKKIDTCSSNPLVYASKQYTAIFGYEMVGNAYFLTPPGISAPKIYFDSKNISIS